MIDPQTRQRYDYDNIERLYVDYVATKIDDYKAIAKLKSIIGTQEVLVLVPGRTLTTHKTKIEDYINQHHPFIISVNFCSNIDNSIAFFGNQKRYNNIDTKNIPMILTSNVKSDSDDAYVINYEGLIDRTGAYFDNSTIMLLNLLRKLEIRRLSIAGFDGFKQGEDANYMQGTADIKRHESEYESINQELAKMFAKFTKTMAGKCEIKFITPSMFEKI